MKTKYFILGTCILILIAIILGINASYPLYRDINVKSKIDQAFWEAILNYHEFKYKQSNIPYISVSGFDSDINKPSQPIVRVTTAIGSDYIIHYDSIKNVKTKELKDLYVQHSFMNEEGHIDIVQIDSLFRERLKIQNINTKTLSTYRDLNKGKTYHSYGDMTSFSEKDINSNLLDMGINSEIQYETRVKYPYNYVIETIAKETLPYLIIISVLLITLISLCILKRVRRLQAIRDAKREKEIEALVEAAKKEVKERIEEEIRAIKTQDGVPVVEVDNVNKVCRTLNYYYDRKIQGGMSRQNKELMTLFLHKPHHTLLQSEIIIGLWGGMVKGYKERLKKCIQRFRENLEEFTPELNLVTIKGEGYTLIIPNPDIIDEVVVIEPLDFQGTEAELNKVRRIEIQKIKAVEDTKKRLEEERLQSQNEAAASTHKKTPEEKQPKQDEQDEQNKQNEEDRIE